MKRSPCPGTARRFVRQVTAAAIEANVNVIFWGTAMRKNLPVTNVEHLLGDDTLIVSRTDTKGRIVFFNDQFVAASGFTEAEMMKQPHNIVRHPDMPPKRSRPSGSRCRRASRGSAR